jgi:hypothetical protein
MNFSGLREGQKAQKPQQTRIEHSDGSDLSELLVTLERNLGRAIDFNLPLRQFHPLHPPLISPPLLLWFAFTEIPPFSEIINIPGLFGEK